MKRRILTSVCQKLKTGIVFICLAILRSLISFDSKECENHLLFIADPVNGMFVRMDVNGEEFVSPIPRALSLIKADRERAEWRKPISCLPTICERVNMIRLMWAAEIGDHGLHFETDRHAFCSCG